MTEKILRVGILGLGRSGRDLHLWPLHDRLKDIYHVVAAADGVEERRKKAEQEFGIDTYSDWKELLKRDDLDLVVNAMPSHLHVETTLEAMKRGIQVLVEKPLAPTAREADLLIQAAFEMKKPLAVFHNSRFAPAFLRMKEIIASGILGQIAQITVAYRSFSRRWDWQTLKSHNGGSLLNAGSHAIDLALGLSGLGTNKPDSLICRMNRVHPYGDAEDYVKLLMQMPGCGPVVDVEISSSCSYPTSMFHIQGSLGGLKGDLRRLEWKYFRPEEAEEHCVTTDPFDNAKGRPGYCSEELPWRNDSWSLEDISEEDYYHGITERFYRSLYDSLVHGSALAVHPEEIRQLLAVMDECRRQNPVYS